VTVSATTLRRELEAEAQAQGFLALRVARATPDLQARDVLRARIGRGDYSGLPWFGERWATVATDPERLLDGARSVVVLAAAYGRVATPPHPVDGALRGRVARYAWGRDYHRLLPKKARPLLRLLEERVPGSTSRFVADSHPLAERAYAAAAGLGWQGKNSMLLMRGLGSFTVLSAIVTTVALEADEPSRESCGSCRRCLPACPTGAIRSAYEVVNDRCIAFWTIEHRGAIPRAIRPALGDWVFGCDVCQDVCPANENAGAGAMPGLDAADLEAARPDLLALLATNEDDFRRRYRGRAVARANHSGLVRNACVALGNLGDRRAVPALHAALAHPEPVVRGHAAWALGRLDARRALAGALPFENDPAVREEILAALDGPSAAEVGA
jgi:epoxyqueuosine reductase